MQFIIGENLLNQLERFFYRGGIGLYYNSTLSGVLTYLIFGLVCFFTVIGLITSIKWLFNGKKRKDDRFKKWIKTGKM